MAIYHYHREIGKRGDGKNAVFAVAYIRGEKRTCHKTQETKDFTYKHDVIYSECLLPDDAPEWALKIRNSHVKDENGQYLFDKTGLNFSNYAWNQIEIMEKRSDSQLYFHDDFAIPVELNQEAAIELVQSFVKEKLAVNGVFCDTAIHWELINPHAHVVMPLRQLTEEGFSKKRRFGKGDLSKIVTQVRSDWADYANRKMMEQGIDARIDHRSHKARGLELTPTVKVGKATYMTDTKYQEIRVAENQLIRAQNFEKVKENPDLLATKVAQEHHEFTHAQVKDELAKYVVGEQVLSQIEQREDASREQLVNEIIETLKQESSVFSERELKTLVMEKTDSLGDFNVIAKQIGESDELFNLGLGDDGRTHYVTRQAFNLETQLSQMTERLSAKNSFLVSDVVVERVAKEFGLNEGQRIALKHLTQSGNLALVVGVAGSGKTYMLKAAKAVWEEAGYRVRGVAFSGRASSGLESEAGIRSQTIAGFMQSIRQGYSQFGSNDILVMDEMGMTSLDDMHQITSVVQAAGGKLAGTGDTEQTQPVGRGAPMRAMIEQAGCVVMDTIIRQKVDWQAKATLAMETQQTANGLDAYNEHGQVYFAETALVAKATLVDQWYRQYQQHEEQLLREHILIAYKNETVAHLNQLARDKLVTDGVLEQGALVDTSNGKLAIAKGERVLFSRNDYRLQVKNGDFGTVVKVDGHTLTVKLDNDREITFSTTQYRDFNYGYAATVHKMQSFTGDYAFEYIDSRGYDRHLFLVGSSRHRYNLTIMADHELFKDYDDLKEVVSRHGLKDHIFDYPASFSLRRGFEPSGVAKRTVNFVRRTSAKVQDSLLWLVNYQAYVEKQAKKSLDPHAELKRRRQDAIIVADFCDRRIEIAKSVEALKAMPGYELKLNYQVVPENESIDPKVMMLYTDQETLMFAALDAQGKLTRMMLDTSQMNSELFASIDKKLNDVEGTARLDEKEKAAIFDVTSKEGFIPINVEEKIERLHAIYKQQLQNSELAREIQTNYNKFKLAMDRNRISREAIEKAKAFGDRHEEIKALGSQYTLKQFYEPIIADKIVGEMSLYYGHIVSAFGDNKTKNRFIAELKHQMHQRRYDTAFETFDIEYRSDIKALKHYLDLDYEVGELLADQDSKTDAIKERLQSISNKRNEIAHQIAGNHARFEPIIEHFSADQKRLIQHQKYHQARERVEKFSGLSDSVVGQDNLHKQILAHKIKSAPKLHGIYVNDTLKEGWKSINLENWRYERKHQLSKMSLEFKSSHRLVRRYFDAAYAARDAWQAAIKRRNAQSPNTKAFTLRAQGLSNQRDKIASILIKDMERHAGAIGFEKVDLAKLSARARHYDYFQRYRKESNEMRKMHMAHHINENMKGFGHAVSVSGLYQDIKERARHYDYLHLVNSVPDQAVRDMIRLAERYQQKRIDAGKAWGQVKVARHLGKDTARLLVEAKHITVQRNRVAYEFVQATAQQGMIDPQIKGIKINVEMLNKASQQYIAYQDVMNYLSATEKSRGYFANELLKNRASYHFIFDKKIDFKDLRNEANTWLNSQEMAEVSSTKTAPKKHWDFELISQALMSNPEETYTALFGEPKKRTSKEWRYEGGLIVTLKGNDAGKWYSFTESKGGGPIKAIQEWMGLPFKEALKYGAGLAGLTEAQAMTTEAIQRVQAKATARSKDRYEIMATTRLQSIESAKSIWEGTQPISGTLAERYFNEHRKVSHLSRMEIRHWPIGAEWVNYDDNGERKVQPNKVPAAVIAVRDAQGELTGVQRIYLDKNTAGKATFMDNAKLSKGVIQGSAGIIQKGIKGGRLFIAEGPETGASLAMIDPDATVLVSMGINNLPNLAPVISAFAPVEVVLAADNDGVHSKTRKTTEEAFALLQSNLNTTSISCRLAYPLEIAGLAKVDWNDVLVKQGAEDLKSQLCLMDKTMGVADLYYDHAKSIAYTPAEHYLREVKGLMGVDLSDVRYHPRVPLSGGEGYQQAMIFPVLNKEGKRRAELVMFLSKDSGNITQTMVRGDAQGCIAVLQRGNDTSTVFIADNVIDAKSIAVGNPEANIFVSLDHYRDLGDITWAMDALPKKPGSIALVTDNFDKQNEKELFELSEALRKQKLHVVMVKGRLKGDYTHVSINESLHHQEKVRGTNIIQRIAINPPVQEKQSLKEKLSRAIKGKKILEEKAISIKRPTPVKEQRYYMEFTKTQREKLNAYFNAVDQLSKQDRYQDALEVAKTANAVYDALKEEVRQVNFHPQPINRIQAASEFKLIRERVMKRQSLGLIDTAVLLKEVAAPKMDTKTQRQFSELAQRLSVQDYSKDYEKAAGQFMKDKATLVKAWRKNEAMPGSGHSFSSSDAKRVLTDTIDRDTFLGMTKMLDETVQTQGKGYGKKQGRKKDDDRSRGGRSR
ncbi:MAG: hypothetical protein COV52_09665 [Gammaproteobacteria bacterium CG11_big_fil_rev_8_21_14_0_20_46_22]|nr:MAG: hypothetical protein COV52_09665 [Gammaproteobacteria bacterium CG11_big_fil_rev_8_21_14_0_20_46_22]